MPIDHLNCSARIAAALVALGLVSAQAPDPEFAAPAAPAASPAPTVPAGYETVAIASKAADRAVVTGYLKRPSGVAKSPALVALHGCGGLFTPRGTLTAREIDWVDRLNGLGYAVLLVDSFNSRGFRSVCRLKASERQVRPFDRARDAAAAFAWLAANPAIEKDKIALIGWSHGGSSVLWAADQRLNFEATEMKAAIAFYPGCCVPSESQKWVPRVPVTILIGDADDWTPPETCRTLAAKHPSIRLVTYPGAVHAFDAPNSPLRTLTGLGLTPNGTAKIGTDPKARAASIDEVRRILAEAFK